MFVVCLFWNSGSWATADQTYNGRRFLLFALLGCEGTFLGSFLFFIIIMVANTSDGVQVIFLCFVAHWGDGILGLKNDKVGAFDIWVFETTKLTR